jgi:hypothetical protein
LRSQPTLPEDPNQHLLDYFGNLRSPLWDDMDRFKDENECIENELPTYTEQIAKLEAELAEAKRKSKVVATFKAADPSLYGMKAIVNRLSGFAKFELDHKLTVSHFYQIVMKLSEIEGEAVEGEEAVPASVFSQEQHDKILDIFRRALVEDECPFKGDLNNEVYNQILAAFRAHDPASE